MLLPVIMSGGSGERLWPVSRSAFPKPFMTMPDGQSLIQKAFLRAAGLPDISEIVTVTNRDHYFKTRSEYAALQNDKIATPFILEPVGRNTAPAIAMAASYAIATHGEDTILLVLSADQLIENSAAFGAAVTQALALAQQDYLVTFGITPSGPETGYGYIERAEGHKVKRFVEKPDAATAEKYVASGNHLWNAGIFCFKAGVFLRELAQCSPEVAKAVTSAIPENWSAAQNHIELEQKTFSAIANISVDYAVMEKSSHVAVVACDIGWNDVGSWSAMGTLVAPDKDNNRIVGEVYTHASSDCFIQSSERIVAAVGVKDLIIIDTPDALLVADRNQVQHVKQIVGQLKECGHTASKEHSTVSRPWGTYTILEESPGFKIKRIEVSPHQHLSLQTHEHRSEHWVVVSGKAHVQNDDKSFELLPSQSTYIAAGQKHRLSNNGDEPLVIVEVQCGSYLGEDDIKRYDDHYGRCNKTGAA